MTGDIINLEVRGESAKLQNAIEAANEKAKGLKKTISDIEKDGGKGSENWQKYKNELKATQQEAANLTKGLKNLDISKMTISQMEIHTKALTKELKNADRSSQDFTTNAKRLKDVETELEKAKKQAKGISDEAEKLAKPGVWSAIKNNLGFAFSVSAIDRIVGAIIQFGKEAVFNAAEASDAFGGIKKAIDGITTEEIIELNKEIAKIDTRTAQSELLKIAQIGGQIGVTKEEMLGFVKSVDMAVVALGDEFAGGAEEVSTKLGVLSKIFKETKDLKAGEAISKIGSAINDLGAAGSATGPVIADFATRMGALGNLSPQISQTLGLGAAFQELGLSGEIAASGLKNILNGAATATKLYADQIGMTEDKFKALINSSPNDVILQLAASFRGLPTTEVAKQMDNLGIKSNEAKAVMSLLANQTERVTELQNISAKAMVENTSLTKEFDTMNNTAAAGLAKAGKVVTEFGMMIGTYLLPVLTLLTTGFISLGMAVLKIPAFIKENQTAFTALGVAIVALNGNNIRVAASTIAHSAAEAARTIITKASAIAQNLQLIALIAMEGATKKATTASYLSIAAEKIRVTTANLVTGAQTTLRAITAALTLENIKNTASSTAQTIAEKARALVTNTITGAQTLLRTVTAALTLENIRSTASAVAHTVVEKARTIATNAVAVAQGLLNAVLRANPIGVIITLAAALVAGFMKWYDSSQTLRAGMAGLWSAVKAVGTVIADVWGALTSMDFGKVASILSNAGKDVAKAFTDGYQAKIAEESPKIVSQHKAIVDKKTKDTKAGADAGALAEKEAADKAALDKIQAHNAANSAIDKDQQKADEKALAKKQKQLDDFREAEEKYAQKVKTDREKALELAAQMEAENEQSMADTTLQIEESKLREKARKRKKDIEDSAADANVKKDLLEKIDDNLRLAIDRKTEEFRLKQIKKDQEAAEKKLQIANFIRDQEQNAEMVIFDLRELAAKGNAAKLVAIKKERLDKELEFLRANIEAEMQAEKAKAMAMGLSEEQLSATLKQIETRYHNEGLLAVKENTDAKLEVDKAYHDKKVANMKAFSDVFKGLLSADLGNLITAVTEMVSVSKKGDEDRTQSTIENIEKGLAASQAAVNFLNGLAKAKSDKAIAEANRERDEKVAILNNELAVTESLITSSSNYVEALKTAETARLTELQRILTDETTTEEQKRDALKKYYSDQLQQMKAAEEQKIQDLQHLANMAKTNDEKEAIEAKIAMAKQESAEKIRLAEEELAAKKTNLDELSNFTTDLTNDALAEANAASEKQITIASDEAEQKADFKQDLEETIAAENRKARATEQAEKTKAFKAQKKADIATALITGALAVLKALANFFPLNIILAATAAVVTGVQIAKIKNQPDPVFAQGGTLGHVPQGSKHASIYGHGGIGLFDNRTGANVGEMEGGEAIISTKQTEANWPLIQQMFKNARTPGKTDTPVIPHPATPIAFRDGGKFESPYFERGMYLFGSKKRKAEQAAKDAEAEAAKAQAEADAANADLPSFDGSAYGGVDANDPSASGDTAGANASYAKSQKMGEDQLKAILDLLDETVANGESLGRVVSIVGDLKSSINGVEGAVNSVRDAVYNTNTQGKFDALIGAISSMSA